MANQPKILAWRGQSIEGYCSGAHETVKRVDAGRRFQLSPAKIQSSYGQNIFVRYASWIRISKQEDFI